jgi:hypothetical protein
LGLTGASPFIYKYDSFAFLLDFCRVNNYISRQAIRDTYTWMTLVLNMALLSDVISLLEPRLSIFSLYPALTGENKNSHQISSTMCIFFRRGVSG